MSENVNNKKNKVMVCEAYKKIDDERPVLYLMPLCDSKYYGTLFVGTCMRGNKYPRDYSNIVWRFSADGVIEMADIKPDMKNLSYLSFEKSIFRYGSRIEDYTTEELFGRYKEKYEGIINKFGEKTSKRLQRYISPHPQLNRMRQLAQDHKKILAILAATGLVVSGLQIAKIINKTENSVIGREGLNNVNETLIQPSKEETEADFYTVSNMSKQENIEYSSDSINNNKQNIQFEEVKNLIISSIERVKMESEENPGITSLEYEFFKKYSTTINPNIEVDASGEISSLEELLYCYEHNHQRFITKGNDFLNRMVLDYMKVKLGDIYQIPNWEDIKLTYEEPTGAYEARVRYNGMQLENPGFQRKKTIDDCLQKVKILPGSRMSKLPIESWSTFFAIREFKNFSKYDISVNNYTENEYSNALLENFMIIAKEIETLAKEVDFGLTHESDDFERE